MDVEQLRDEDRFRFANGCGAFITVDERADRRLRLRGRRADGDDAGAPRRGASTASRRSSSPTSNASPSAGTVGCGSSRPAAAARASRRPRRVRRRPFVQWQAPLVWTTLSLTLHADGRSEHALIGASRFPRHWVYGADNRLSHKSGLTDFKDWYRKSFGKHSPWGDEDSEALVSAVESALETSLSAQLMQGGGKRRIERYPAGTVLFQQGEPGTEVLLILDGIVRVERGGERLAEYGPGALLGERAHLEGGVRTSSNIAVTPCRVAMFEADLIDRSHLEELSVGHRREDHARD